MKILIKTYLLSETTTVTKDILSQYINLFWNDIFNPLQHTNSNVHLMIMVKVEFNEPTMGYRTLANLRKVNFSDKQLLIEYLVSRLPYLTDTYKDLGFSKITFSYIVNEGLAEDHRVLLQTPVYEVTTHAYNNMQLPLTMDPTKYGKVLGNEELENNKTRYFTLNNGHVFFIDVSEDLITNNVHIQAPVDLKWTDTKVSDSLFIRAIGKNTLFIENGVVVVKSKELNAKPFGTHKVDTKIADDKSIMTIDIETVNIDGTHKPYLICGYSNGKYINSYANDISTVRSAQNDMFKSFIEQILSFNKLKVIYAHNLSGFDGILLLKHLIKYDGAKIDPVIFNGKLISIKFSVGIAKKARTIVFKDSYLLLPFSLRKLCEAFSIVHPKSYFPFLLSDINYKGVFPSFDLYNDLTYPEYLSLKLTHEGVWSFKDEAIKYCNLDCKCLFDVLIKFNELIFSEFKVDVHSKNTLTLPSLAMKIYKTHYMPKNTIYQILGSVERDIRESFTGGAVDVYKPSNNIFDQVMETYQRIKLYYYDVNSLYPFIMATYRMPTGKPIAFEGDIRKVEPDAFGFFYCKITTPEYLNEPILQRRIQTKDGIRTIAGLGNWTGWVFSTEMDVAMKQGYKFEIIRGYKFIPGHIFKEYVEKMYSLRQQYPKSHPMNLIAKLLMNSLYGKFGMRPEGSRVDMYDTNDSDRMGDLLLVS